MAHSQFLVGKEGNRVDPKGKMGSGYREKNHCVVGVGQLSVAEVEVGGNYQLEEQFDYAQGGYDEIEGVEGFLEAAFQGLGLEEKQDRGQHYEGFCQESGCLFLIDLDEVAAHSTYTCRYCEL